MNSIKVLQILVVCALSQAQYLEHTKVASTWIGKRVDGDKFLLIAHKLSPFFTERTDFKTTFEVIGNYTQVELTEIGVPNYDGSGAIYIDKDYMRANLVHRSVFVTQSFIKVYGFERPVVRQSTP